MAKSHLINKVKNICCIGAGYVGGPTMAVIAYNCPSIQVNVVDINKSRIDAWNDANFDNIPIFEEGLVPILKRTRHNNLHFSNEIEKAIQVADMIFVSVNTPTKTKGLGKGEASDLKWIEKCAKQIASCSRGHTIVVEKSTVPVKTAQVINTILKANTQTSINGQESKTFTVLSNPEFLAEGSAINDLQNPDRVLIGGEDVHSVNLLTDIYKSWVHEERIIKTNIWSSELSKLIANAFLAQRISSINSVSALCEATGADVREVAEAIGADNRIGNKFLNSGPGFGGSCFQKDILNLVYLCKHYGLNEVAEYWEGVLKINDFQKNRISQIIIEKMFGNLNNKKIAILGFAFKNATNDTRESPSIQIAKHLLAEGAQLIIHDPKVNISAIQRDLENYQYIPNYQNYDDENNLGTWTFCKTIDEAFIDTCAVVILTDWEEYSKINWDILCPKMSKPGWIFDARSIVEISKIKKIPINYWRVGQGLNAESKI